jgi:tRNA/tmRNA/rRNA uracil-C5-methylase (TrmA/RlmC/RlmD family)
VLTFDNVSKRKAEILDALCGTGLFTRGVAEHVVFYRGLFISRNAQFAARVANALSAIGVKCELDCKPVQRGVG